MGVITAPKHWGDIHHALFERGDLPVVVIGGDDWSHGCSTGDQGAYGKGGEP